MSAAALRLLHRDDDRADVYSPRTPVLVRCAVCGARFGEALGRPPRSCPHCGLTVRVAPWWLAIGSGWRLSADMLRDSTDERQIPLFPETDPCEP